MVSQSYQNELKENLKEIGLEIIKESEKEFPDAIKLKAKIDDLSLVIELIKRESKQKYLSRRLYPN